jgi:CRP/FNR family transcriptional regulator, cyclic AMP receptor protein
VDDRMTMLELTRSLPEVDLAAGHALLRDGEPNASIWVLVSGELTVSKGGVEVSVMSEPGTTVGEVSVLLGTPATATVTARTDARLRVATDGAALLAGNPSLSMHLATGLARRLDLVTTYLADLRQQYGTAPGIAMVGEVLGQLTQAGGTVVRPGSARDPDPEY